LQSVADATGGRYFHAENRGELATIYTELDRMDTREIETESYRPRTDLFHWPIGALLATSLLYGFGLLIKERTRAHG
jgi:Ca-activated chloride channel family protein